MKNDMEFTNMLIECGVTSARLDALLELLDNQDGGNFLSTGAGTFIKRRVQDIKRIFDRNIAEAQPFYTIEDAERLFGAVCVLYEYDSDEGSRISDDAMDEVEEVTAQIMSAYKMYRSNWIRKGELL